MEFKKLVSPSLKDMFIEQIQGMILSGKLGVGEQLPPERAMADSMGVSRAVVGSGIMELERKGFLVVKPRIGVFVADYRRKGNIETLRAIMMYNQGKLRDEEVRAILEIRDALDKLAVKGIIEVAKEENLELLQKLAEKIKEADNNEKAAQGAFEFQHEMAMLSGNALLPLIFRSFYDPITLLWERFCLLHGKERLYKTSYCLWEYLYNKDLKGAIEWIDQCTLEVTQGEVQIYY